ncbi:MAG: hypothetical protein V3575_05005, partial [Candidatus Absconditabacteria bacterium]
MDKLISFKSYSGDDLNGILKSKFQLNNKIVIFVPGFERCGTTEPKFRYIGNLLRNELFTTFQFDFTGLGISGGDFFDSSIESCTQDLNNAILELNKLISDLKIYIVAHSY